VCDQALAPGLYSWENQGKSVAHGVVNFPAVESDLRSLRPEEIRKAGAVVAKSGSAVRHLRDGIKLWPHLLALGFALVLAEGATLLWAERRQS
jgi:hypothetical protein